jgi:hypothetical protein
LGEDFVDKEGNKFSGFGTLFGCGLKLCPNCMARAGARNRAITRRVVDEKNTKLERREHYCYITGGYIVEQERYRFVTLTMPQIFASFKKTMKIQKRAWDLFRKLKIVKNYFAAMIKAVEFTVRENGTYHDHIHLLAISFFLPDKLLKQAWTDCVRTAFEEFGIEFVAEQANVNYKLVRNPADMVKEVCKYITKTTTWEKIPADQLIEIAEIERWDRMFELSGRFRETIQRLKAEDAAAADSSSSANKETTLTDGVAHELNYFNTDGITDGELLDSQASGVQYYAEEQLPAKRADENLEARRREGWRDVIRREGLKAYRKKFNHQLEYARKIRKLRLMNKYPEAKFTNLDGTPWGCIVVDIPKWKGSSARLDK